MSPVSTVRFDRKSRVHARAEIYGDKVRGQANGRGGPSAFSAYTRGLVRSIERTERFGPTGHGSTAKPGPLGTRWEPSWKKTIKAAQTAQNIGTVFAPTGRHDINKSGK